MSENKLGNVLKQNVAMYFRFLHFLNKIYTQRKKCVRYYTTVIKKYGECCCRERSSEKAGIINTESGASNISNSVSAFGMSCDRNILRLVNVQRLTLGFPKVKYVALNVRVHRFFNNLGGASKF